MVSLADILAAEMRISQSIIHTPLVYSHTISEITGANVYLKLETLQKAGSFKVRGASNKILLHLTEIGHEGVVAASAGNHAQGVAVAAHSAGIPATIVMPEWSSVSKQEATRGYGAQVIIHGRSLEESIQKAQDIAHTGRLFIHPYDDDEVIAGQGSIAMEIFTDLPNPDLIVVPVGGGGLIAGIAIAAKAKKPEIKIIGVQAAACLSVKEALCRGSTSRVMAGKTIADGIRVAETGSRTLPLIKHFVDQLVLASEEEIADAMLLLLERKHIVAEGAGAVPLAAIMNGSIDVKQGSNIVLVISGGNVESSQLFRVIRQSLNRQGRSMHFSVMLDDQPGTLARLLSVIAKERGNILHIHHAQGDSDIPVLVARVTLELETRGWEHIASIKKALLVNGYEILIG
ncbi:MAG: threonine ammonia-lyase [Methanoregula sp.]|jgi:threonine dehydratase|nr:threonine ammonia-lyase [Methanoregula sp.]